MATKLIGQFEKGRHVEAKAVEPPLDACILMDLHDTLHAEAEKGDIWCSSLRRTHETVVAEILWRGMEHDTPIICPSMGKNGGRCAKCIFSEMPPPCNESIFNLMTGWRCSWGGSPGWIELEPPHPSLIITGQQTAIANDEPLSDNKIMVIVGGGQAHGFLILDLLEPTDQKQIEEFDRDDGRHKHCVSQQERLLRWPEATSLYIHTIRIWHEFDSPRLFVDGKIKNYKPTDGPCIAR